MKSRILFVEDDRFLNQITSFVFEELFDFKLFVADNEYSALSMLEEIPLDGVITDLHLNNFDGGISVLFSAVERDLPVAVMTADVAKPDDYYLNLGASMVLRKPFDSTELPHIAHKLVGIND